MVALLRYCTYGVVDFLVFVLCVVFVLIMLVPCVEYMFALMV